MVRVPVRVLDVKADELRQLLIEVLQDDELGLAAVESAMLENEQIAQTEIGLGLLDDEAKKCVRRCLAQAAECVWNCMKA